MNSRGLLIAGGLIAGTMVAGLLFVLRGSIDAPTRLRSTEFATAAERIRELKNLVPFDAPADDALFDITTADGLLTPGPQSVDACIVLKVPPARLDEWTAGWSSVPLESALDVSCGRRLGGERPGFTVSGDRLAYRSPSGSLEERSVFVRDGIVVWRIAR